MATTTTTTGTTSGRLRGATEGGVAVFRGVPYARPPVGPLRFAPPQPPDAWTGVRDATAFGPPAMQAANPVTGRAAVAPPSEDCLTLNVWTPAPDAGRRPVLVWLHGGAFVFGAGSSPATRGATLARRGDAVVVTLNYRLGLFGYLRGVDVCGDALPSTGNAGLLDQLAALRWVRDEIAAFGGDPANVTVVGQSAGAAQHRRPAGHAPGARPLPQGDPAERGGHAGADARRRQPGDGGHPGGRGAGAARGGAVAGPPGRPARSTCRRALPPAPPGSPTAPSPTGRRCPPIRRRPWPRGAPPASPSWWARTWRSRRSSGAWTPRRRT